MRTNETITVAIHAVAADPERYSFSFPTPGDGADLRESLSAHGQLLPLAALRESGTLTVVDGARRLALLRELGAPTVTLTLLDPSRLWDEALTLRLASGAKLNAVETGLYIKKRSAEACEPLAKLAREVFPLLGLPPREGAAHDPLWLASLPPEDALSFAAGDFSTSGVRLLAGAPREDALAALKALRGFRLGVNKFTEAARLILECAWREGATAADWLGRTPLPAPQEGGDRLREELKALRYPKVTALTASFAADAASLGLPKRALLSHAPGFEGGKLRLTLSFASLEELEKDAAAVVALAQAGEMDLLERYLD